MIDHSTLCPLKFMTLVIGASLEWHRYRTVFIIIQGTWATCSTKTGYSETEVNEKLLHYDSKKCSIVLITLPFTFLFWMGRKSYRFWKQSTKRERKYFIFIKREYNSPSKEWFCPSGHVGLEHNDSQCRPSETNCHWPPWIFQGTLNWKWTIQFPTGSLAISLQCITEKASTFGLVS